MSIRTADLKTHIIIPALQLMGEKYSSDVAVQLLLATAAQESHMGEYLHQVNGPALGIFQMEPATFVDTLTRATNILGALYPTSPSERLIYDLRYATIVARAKYWLDPHPLPQPDDINGLWEIYKRVWNTHLGAATQQQFLGNYAKYVEGV
jgi:hypothetical protein